MNSRRLQKLSNNKFCWYCGDPPDDVDHKIPKSRGGASIDKANLVAACRKCNNAKGSLTVEEFREFLKERHKRKSTKHSVVKLAPFDFVFFGER